MATYEAKDFSKVIIKRLQENNEKKFIRIKNAVEQAVNKESKRVLRFIGDTAVNSTGNPFFNESPIIWPELNEKYAKRKGTKNFWINKGYLDKWLFETNSNRVFGAPRVEIINKRKTGKLNQSFTLRINYFPNKRLNVNQKIYNRLFAKTKVRLNDFNVVFLSNEERRPIIQPGLQAFAEKRLNRTVRQTVKGVLKS